MNITTRIKTGLVALVLGLGTGQALAGVDNNGAFELDGNANESGAPGDDWDTPPKPGGSATAFTGIVPDKNGSDNIFTGGGSKTPNPIGDWLWKSNPAPPDKNNITNAYAANYNVGGDQIIYFGADLFDDNGDAELAFWFFQNAVGTQPPSPATQGDFFGSHVNGDPYVAVKFSNGGTVANIAVYEWDDTCTKPPGNGPFPAGGCAANNIRVVVAEGPATCNNPGGEDACAISNPGPGNTDAPWPYLSKDGTDDFPPTTFFEGGICINCLFGENKCFSSFGVVSGASTSFTATAKDFVLNDFDVCSVAASKTCVNDSDADDSPTAITYNVRGCAINDGGGTINVDSLLNSIAGGANAVPGDLMWVTPGQVDDGGIRDFNPATDCDDAALLLDAFLDGAAVTDPTTHDLEAGAALVYQFSETTSMNGVSDTVTIDASGTDGTDIDDATDTATCPLRTFDAGLTVTKHCAADLEDVGSALQVKINVQGMVCNNGEVQLTNLQLTDSILNPLPAGVTDLSLTPDSTTLEPQGETGECTNYTGSYTPDSLPTGDLCPFADTVDASAEAPINSGGTGCSGTPTICRATSNTATCSLRIGNDDGMCSTGLVTPALPN